MKYVDISTLYKSVVPGTYYATIESGVLFCYSTIATGAVAAVTLEGVGAGGSNKKALRIFGSNRKFSFKQTGRAYDRLYVDYEILKTGVQEALKKQTQLKLVKPTAGNADTSSSGSAYWIARLSADGTPLFSPKPKVHVTELSAKAEAERLAKENPGVRFMIVKRYGEVVCGGMVWS